MHTTHLDPARDGGAPDAAGPEPAAQMMLRMISGFWVSRAIFAAARLGLADHLERGPRTVEELASATCTHAPSLHRLLRALASAGVFRTDSPGRFALTPLGETLRSEAPGSLRSLAIAELGQEHYQAWEHVLYSVRTGNVAFRHRFGIPLDEYYALQEESGTVCRLAKDGVSEMVDGAVVEAYDYSRFPTVVQVGGGPGRLLVRILSAHPGVRGVLYESPRETEPAWRCLEAHGLTARCEVVAGDPLQKVPAGGDAYLLRGELHRRDDEGVLAILRSCARAMSGSGRLLLVESIVPPDDTPSLAPWLDLDMMVMLGGRERTEAEYRELLVAAGLRVARVRPTGSIVSVIEAVPA